MLSKMSPDILTTYKQFVFNIYAHTLFFRKLQVYLSTRFSTVIK